MSRRTKGFTMVEMAVALTIAVSLFGLIAMALGDFRVTQEQNKLVSLEARELAMVQDAADRYVKANKAGWTAGQRVEISVATLIAGAYLPVDFAKRVGPAGSDAVGSTPFGQPYRVVAIKHATDGKVRTIITESQAPLAARLARAGIASDVASIAALKSKIAGVGVSNHKAIAGTVAGGATSANGYLGSFNGFPLATWLQTAPTQAITVYFLGFPELGSDGGTGGPTTTQLYEDIEVVDGQRGCPFHDQYCDTSAYVQPTCTGGREQVGEWPTCDTGLIYQTLIGTLTNGRTVATTTNPEVQCDGNGDGIPEWFPSTTNSSNVQTTSLNNQNFYTSSAACEAMFWATPPGGSCPQQYHRWWKMNLGAKNRLCGRPVSN